MIKISKELIEFLKIEEKIREWYWKNHIIPKLKELDKILKNKSPRNL